MTSTYRGFALLISIVLTAVVLAVGEALIDIAYKQLILASSAKGSQVAFYNGDSALECALYWDQKFNTFSTAGAGSSITCNSAPIVWGGSTQLGSTLISNYTVPCAGGGTSAKVSVYKDSSGTTDIYANGYSSCDLGIKTLIERGVKVHY